MVVWWISCKNWTVRVATEEAKIVEAAPIVRKFIGQPITNLLRWAGNFGGLVVAVFQDGEFRWISAPTAASISRSETGRSPAPVSGIRSRALSGLAERQYTHPKKWLSTEGPTET